MTIANFTDRYLPDFSDMLPAPAKEPVPEVLINPSLCSPVNADILRLDAIHPTVSGNKWYKLKYNILDAHKQGFDHLLSFGGMHSNHLHALAAAGQHLGFKTTAIVRGYPDQSVSRTIQECQQMGMQIELVNKATYQRRYEKLWCEELAATHQAFVIPEGGNNAAGQLGCQEIAHLCEEYDEVWLSIGSGATYTGILQGLRTDQSLVGVMALKGAAALVSELLCARPGGIARRIVADAHWGGFAKCPAELVEFIRLADSHGLPLDPVYTAKLMYAFRQYAVSAEFDVSKRYLLIHTGGLQGRAGIKALSAL
jgi:1-aminocyclopropane-1-carboxylate deaminase